MDIHGLQKMTLLDYPEKVAATIFLGGCDFRCPYCHNFELVEAPGEPVITQEELFSFLEKRRGILDGVTVTGGEPCLRKDLKDFVAQIKEMGYLVKLDTNGNHPEVLMELAEGDMIDYVAMDIKNSLSKYGMTIGVPDFDTSNVEKSIDYLIHGKIPYELRTTVVSQFHKKEDFEEIGRTIEGARAYFLQQFVQRETVPDTSLTSPSREDMEIFLETVRKYVPTSEIRGI